MKISKEIKTALIALLSILLLVAGVNFLKGNSFFGGDDVYYAYFSNSAGVQPASSVVLNGVSVGKILEVKNNFGAPEDKQILIKFNLTNHDLKLPIGTKVELGPIDLFSKGIILTLGDDESKGFYKPGDELIGTVAVDLFTQVKAYADPVTTRLQGMVEKLDNLATSFSVFWDETATSDFEQSMVELRETIHSFGNVAKNMDLLLEEEKSKLGQIFSNVESITHNLKLSNDKVAQILGNTAKISDDLVKSDFKKVIGDAQKTIDNFNTTLTGVNNGEGTLGKLVKDEALYSDLVKTNKDLQNLLLDLQTHPERYVHLSLIGRKTKGVPIPADQEEKLKKLLDSIPD